MTKEKILQPLNQFLKKIYKIAIEYGKRIYSVFLSWLPWLKKYGWIVALSLFVVLGSIYGNHPPSKFPSDSAFTIDKGQSLMEVAKDLGDKHIIRSPFILKTIVILIGGEKNIVAGSFYLEKPVSAYQIARMITGKDTSNLMIKVTIPEGLSIYDVAQILQKKIPKFDVVSFLKLAKDKEGYLFPDTYLILPNATPNQVISLMQNTFDKRVSGIETDIKKFGKPLKDVVIMASIIENEARLTDTRRMISGILWKRLEMGMPLQADATFEYINGKNSFNLTLADLKIDSPYNTYLYKGLPPTPICNPGLDALSAAVNPTKSNYLYFLSDLNGVMHYAATFAEHVANKNKYLK